MGKEHPILVQTGMKQSSPSKIFTFFPTCLPPSLSWEMHFSLIKAQILHLPTPWRAKGFGHSQLGEPRQGKSPRPFSVLLPLTLFSPYLLPVQSVPPGTGDEIRIGLRIAQHRCDVGGPARGNGASLQSLREKGGERNKIKPPGDLAAARLHDLDPCLPLAAALLGGKRGCKSTLL